MRSPRLSIAADIAETRSSSTPCCRAEAMIKPSTETTADASMSGAAACILRRRSTIRSERDFVIKGLLNISLSKFTILQISRHTALACGASVDLLDLEIFFHALLQGRGHDQTIH